MVMVCGNKFRGFALICTLETSAMYGMCFEYLVCESVVTTHINWECPDQKRTPAKMMRLAIERTIQ